MPEVAFHDRALYLPGADALVVADLHVGRDEASDVAFPLGEAADLEERLSALLRAVGPAEVVFAGDLLHRFAGVSVRTEEAVRALTEACRSADARPVVVRGNHDTAISQVWDGGVHDSFRAGEAVVCHGHAEPEADAALYVVGHDHPAIEIEGRKRPCFLRGEAVYRGADLVMLPAFSRLARGALVNGMRAGDFQSPLVTDADALSPVVYDADAGEALTFPPLGELRRLL